MSVDGILNVLKPAGRTSFSVVSLLRRLSGGPRVGHAGTLDPEATGVLVICFGQATRAIEFLTRAGKTYQAEIELGAATDTYDASGRVVQIGDASRVTEEQIRRLLLSFCGSVEQVPPMYSALKYKGQRLYQLARQGIEVPRKPRQVQILRLELLRWQPPVVTVEVECGGGTYIRSLAHDLGIALGSGAFLRKLVRLKSEPFHISQATPLHAVEDAFRCGHWQRYIYAVDEVLLGWQAVILSEASEAAVRNGRTISLEVTAVRGQAPVRCRAYSSDGRFLAVLRQVDEGLWHPDKVFHLADLTESA